MKNNNTFILIVKSFIIAIVALFVLATVGAIILMTKINPNKYKPLIITQMEQKTGHPVRIDGDIKWRFIPFFGLEANKIAIENANTLAPKKDLLSIGSITLVVELMPLLHKNVIINKLTINDLALNLIKSDQLNKPQKKLTAQHNTNAATSLINNNHISIELQQFALKNASITYTNLATNKSYKLNHIDFNIGNGSAGTIDYNNDSLLLKNFDFRVDKTLQGMGSIQFNNLSQHLDYVGTIKTLPFSLNRLFNQFGLPKIVFPNRKILENVSFEAGIEGDSNNLKIKDMLLALDNIQVTGNIAVNSFTPANVYDKLKISTFNLADIKPLNGFGLIMQSTNTEGSIHANSLAEISDLTKITLNQNIASNDVQLVGFSVGNFIKRFDSAFNISVSNVKNIRNAKDIQTTLTEQAINLQAINDVKKSFEPFAANGPKDPAQRTDLGSLQARIALNHGILTTPLFLLSGPLETVNGSGDIDFNRKNINYLANIHFKSPTENSMLNQIIFPLQLQGPLSNMQKNLNWGSVTQQIIRYQEKSVTKNLRDQVKQGASNLFNRLFK